MKPPEIYKRSPETIQKLRDSHIGIRHGIGYSERQSAIMRKIYSNPEMRFKNSESKKKSYSENPILKSVRRSAIISRYNNPDFKEFLVSRIVESKIGGFWYGNVRYESIPKKYCEKFNEEFRERCRVYWMYECVVCGAKEGKTKLSVHHVHYDKKMCCNGSPKDVVALCKSCHAATNYNRDMWENAFTELIYSNPHNGKSYLTVEEFDHIKNGN